MVRRKPGIGRWQDDKVIQTSSSVPEAIAHPTLKQISLGDY